MTSSASVFSLLMGTVSRIKRVGDLLPKTKNFFIPRKRFRPHLAQLVSADQKLLIPGSILQRALLCFMGRTTGKLTTPAKN